LTPYFVTLKRETFSQRTNYTKISPFQEDCYFIQFE